jgi:hypothetical protein
MMARGIPVSSNSEIKKIYYPDATVHPIYAKGFEKFQRLNELLKEEF